MRLAADGSQGRAAALAILAVVLALAWLGPGNAYTGMIAAGSERLAEREALLQRYRGLAHSAPEAPAPAASPLLFPDLSEAQAAALLQERVKSAAAANQIQIRTLQVLQSETVAQPARITVRVRGAGDTASLGRLLYAIETAHPVLYPDNLQVHAVPGAAAGTLEFQLDVTGFRNGPSA